MLTSVEWTFLDAYYTHEPHVHQDINIDTTFLIFLFLFLKDMKIDTFLSENERWETI